MQTPLDENVLRSFRLQRQKIDGVPAVVGRLGANGAVDVSLDPRVDGNPNRLYALIGGNRAETAVWNTGKFIVNWRYPGANVRVAPNAEGEWEIIAGDARAADRVFGRAAGQVLSPPQTIPELNETPVPGRNLLPGRVRSWVSGTLEVNAERFLYTDTAGNEKEWLPTTANTLDLAASVPSAIGGVSAHRYVKIAFDPDATTPTLVSFAGTPQVITMPLATDGYTAIAITDGFIQLDTVILTTGDADETDIPEADWRYTRRLQAESVGAVDADDVSYTPDVSGDWDTPPSVVAPALDELADRVTDLEATSGSGATAILYSSTLGSAGIFDIDLTGITGGTGYHDLEITALLRSTVSGTSGDVPYLFWNTDTTPTNYQYPRMRADFTPVIQEDGNAPIVGFANSSGQTSSYFASLRINILSYGGSALKVAMVEATYYDGSTLYRWSGVHQWVGTAAITRLRIQPDGYATDTWDTGSRMTIMGINPV